MRTWMQWVLLLFGLICAIELALAVPIVTAGFAYRGSYYPTPTGLPYYRDTPPAPSLYPANPYPLGYSYGYGFGSFTLTPFIFW
ncbi:PREDICTED: uncharacterized protein LOC108370236 isoform X3 [Rhagoletis zephyria]|uniref:uncharacterized protein LOC108370236 isoform X3 n=1 Tax=Rhagoletis zephyria TaxID=28612 RepID=UPI0008117CE0|nr:PREDICTED: uncharacterized protein LOC108370236 isoform X3 [Rhagoletis zephyria]